MSRRLRLGFAVLFAMLPASAAPVLAVQALTPHITLTPTYGPPTAKVKVKGSHFPVSQTVNITFDSTAVASATTTTTGTFSASFAVPATALPGPHAVAASDSQGVGAGATFTVHTDWALASFDAAGSAFNPYENELSEQTVGHISQSADPQWGGFLHSEPIYVNGVVYVGSSDGTIRAFDPLTGGQIWQFTAGGAITGSPIAIIPRLGQTPCAILAGSSDGNLIGVDPTSGQGLFQVSTGSPITGSPIAFRLGGTQLVALVNGAGTVAEYNGCTGAEVWSLPGSASPVPNETPAFLPAVQLPDGTKHAVVFVGLGSGLDAIDAATGTLLWSTSLTVSSSPTAYGGGTGSRVLVGNGPGLLELNGSTGNLVWGATVNGNLNNGIALYRAPGRLGQTLQSIIAGDSDGDVYSFNPKTGAIFWRNPGPGGSPAQPASSVAVANGVAYLTLGPNPSAGVDGKVVALNVNDGTLLFSADTADLNPQPYPPAPPTIADGMVFVGDFSGGLRVFSSSAP